MSFFCGHVQETFYLVLLLTGCMLWDARSAPWPADRRALFALPLRWSGADASPVRAVLRRIRP